MISISINGEKQSNNRINQQWIAEQINNRRHENQDICIQFDVRCGDIDLRLSAGKCPSPGKSQPLSSFSYGAQKIIKHWKNEGLGDKEIKPGMVISFWQYLNKKCN